MPVRKYQYTAAGVMSLIMNFSGDSIEIDLTNKKAGEVIKVNVMFQNHSCQSIGRISTDGEDTRI